LSEYKIWFLFERYGMFVKFTSALFLLMHLEK